MNLKCLLLLKILIFSLNTLAEKGISPGGRYQNISYPQSSQSSTNIDNIKLNFDFGENSPFQEGVMSETFQRPDKSFLQEPKELSYLINKENLVHTYLPKQTDID